MAWPRHGLELRVIPDESRRVNCDPRDLYDSVRWTGRSTEYRVFLNIY